MASETTTSTSTAPATSIEPVQTLAVFGNAQSAACVANRSIIDTALMTFVSATGSANATEAEMVGYGLIVGDVPGWQIGPGNVIIATPGGECAG